MYLPAIGESVVIEDVQSGSRDVVGMTGTLAATAAGIFTVSVVFSPTTTVQVHATKVRPA